MSTNNNKKPTSKLTTRIGESQSNHGRKTNNSGQKTTNRDEYKKLEREFKELTKDIIKNERKILENFNKREKLLFDYEEQGKMNEYVFNKQRELQDERINFYIDVNTVNTLKKSTSEFDRETAGAIEENPEQFSEITNEHLFKITKIRPAFEEEDEEEYISLNEVKDFIDDLFSTNINGILEIEKKDKNLLQNLIIENNFDKETIKYIKTKLKSAVEYDENDENDNNEEYFEPSQIAIITGIENLKKTKITSTSRKKTSPKTGLIYTIPYMKDSITPSDNSNSEEWD